METLNKTLAGSRKITTFPHYQEVYPRENSNSRELTSVSASEDQGGKTAPVFMKPGADTALEQGSPSSWKRITFTSWRFSSSKAAPMSWRARQRREQQILLQGSEACGRQRGMSCRERREEMPFLEGDKARQTNRQNIKWDLAKLPGSWSPTVIITTAIKLLFFTSAVTNSNSCQLKQEGL